MDTTIIVTVKCDADISLQVISDQGFDETIYKNGECTFQLTHKQDETNG